MTKDFDIIIIGGGLVGVIAAISFAKIGLSIAIIERRKTDFFINPTHYDGRDSAITKGSWDLLADACLTDQLIDYAGKIEKIKITDQDSILGLEFDNQLIGSLPLGYMIDNVLLLQKSYEAALRDPNIKIFDSEICSNVEFSDNNVAVTLLNDKISGSFLIAADGKHSELKRKFDIKTIGWDYDQAAIVFHVEHSLNHQNIAEEKFFKSGPFAILPLYSGYESAIVWTEAKATAKLLMQMPESEFMYFAQKKLGDSLGAVKLATKPFSYPLSVGYVQDYYYKRMLIIGDAAHSIHPIAGQGLNLGLKDVARLRDLISTQLMSNNSIDFAMLATSYQSSARPVNLQMIAATSMLDVLFSNDWALLKLSRRLGLALVNQVSFVQKFLMKYAMK